MSKEFGNLLTEGKQIEIGFRLIGDIFIFTNKRLLLVDKQSLTGMKIDYLLVIYKNISSVSIEKAGHFGLNTELKIRISNEVKPSVTKYFNK